MGPATTNRDVVLALPGPERLKLGEELGSGGQGEVRRLSSGLVAKLYRPSLLENGKRHALRKKVNALLALRRATKHWTDLASIAWPERPLHDERGHFIGYAMRHVAGRPLHEVMGLPELSLPERASVAHQLARMFAALHAVGLAVGDGSSSNVLVDRQRDSITASVIDADSFHLTEFPCVVATPRYRLPEVVRGEERFAAGVAADRHVLAFLLFELFTAGWSPYAHKMGESPEENLAKGFFACAQDHALAPDTALCGWNALPRSVQHLFTRAFSQAKGPRPSAAEWSELLSRISFSRAAASPAAAHVVAPAAAAMLPRKRRLFSFWSKTG